MKKFILLLLILTGAASAQFPYPPNQNFQLIKISTCTATTCTPTTTNGMGTLTGGFPTADGIGYYRLSWTVDGTVSACSASLDSQSNNGAAWTTGGIASAGTIGSCATAGSYTTATPVYVNFARIAESITGSGNVTFTLLGGLFPGSVLGTGTLTGVSAGTGITVSGAAPSPTVGITAGAVATFSSINSTIYMDGTVYPLTSTGLGNAITAAGSGGTVIIPGTSVLALSASTTMSNPVNILCIGSTITFTTAARLLFNSPNSSLSGCNLQGPDMATMSGAPIVFGNGADASGGRFMSNSFNGWGSTNSNGVALFINSSHIEVGDNRAGDIATGSTCTVSTASWATPVSGTMFGAETITFVASGSCASAFPSDFAVGNAILCKSMSPVGYNGPGDGQSIPFGQIITVAYPSLTVQQIYNPGTYVSGGTCQSGIGNAEEDIVFNMTGSAKIVADWNIHDNDVGTIVLHNSTSNSIISGVKLTNNTVHPLLDNGYYWGIEVGPFQGANSSVPYAFHSVTLTSNICKMVADAAQGCFSQSGTQDVTETGQYGYSGGHTYSTQMDENAAVQNFSSVGGVFNGLGGGPIEDFNRANHSVFNGASLFYPAPTTQFLFLTVANGGVGGTSINSNSFNTITGNTLTARVDICPLQTVLTNNNVCGAQILNIVGAAGTATVTFTSGVVNPGLAAGQNIVISGNSVAGGCSGSTLNASVAIASVIGSGTGFTVTNASINGQTCTGGKAQSSGLNNPTSTTDVATFSTCPHPFKVGDTAFSITGAGVSGYNIALTTVTAITQLPPCTATYTGGSSLAQSGSGFAGNFNGKYIWGQMNIANGGSIDQNIIADNNIIGAGLSQSTGVAFNFSNNGTTGTIDGNQFTHNNVTDVAKVLALGGSGSLGVTNSKIELGNTKNFTSMFLSWANGSTIADSSSNPQSLTFTGTGVATSSVTLFLYPANFGTGTVPLTTATATTEGDWLVAKHAGTIQGMFCTSTAVGVSGVVTFRKNKATTPITCSLASATSCNDTSHSGTVAQGDVLSLQVATGAAETLANVKCSVYLWYQDN